MVSPADRFTRLQKIAIFLVVVGEEKARQILTDLDVETIEQINAAIASLGPLTAQEKASVMIEFGDLFFKDKPLKAKPQKSPPPPVAPPPAASQPPSARSQRQPPPAASQPPSTKPQRQPPPPSSPVQPKEEDTAVHTALQHLKQRVDPGKIDWSRAGYDFGEDFKGPPRNRR